MYNHQITGQATDLDSLFGPVAQNFMNMSNVIDGDIQTPASQ